MFRHLYEKVITNEIRKRRGFKKDEMKTFKHLVGKCLDFGELFKNKKNKFERVHESFLIPSSFINSYPMVILMSTSFAFPSVSRSFTIKEK